jgi:hypothetical protein
LLVGHPWSEEMFQPNYRIVLGILAAILVAASGLWSLLTYWPDRLGFAPSGSVSGASGWGSLLILTVGLAVGCATCWYVIGKKELPGGIWAMLVAGVLGAWLGGVFLGNWGLVWEKVNVVGSAIIAFALAWGGGQILAHLGGKDKNR